jgi:uncharacterized protein (TIGR03435 family)
MGILKSLAAVSLLATAAIGQTNTRPSFDIADVHMSPRNNWSQIPTNQLDGGVLGGDRYEIRRASMLDLVRNAYGIDADKVFGGPDWLEYDRYDIVAKTKPGTKPAVLKQMLQTLLGDRFHLVLKQESQLIPGFVLTAAQGEPKMKSSEGEGPGTCEQGRPTFNNAPPPTANVQCRNISMAAFADWLHLPARKPVLDSTRLDGTWDFELHYPMGGAAGSEPPVFGALSAAGLKIDPGKVPQVVLTVVSVDEQPTPTPARVSEALPPLPPAQFEVASLRPCDKTITLTPRFQSGSRVTANCEPVLGLIKQAFGLPILQRPIGAPKSFEGSTDYSNITIAAKAPADAPQDRDTLNTMLRALLIDRYKIAFHYEDQPMDTATLVAAKPKLTKADPTGRTGCARQFPEPAGARGSQPTRLVCHNMTMAQFAEQMPVYDYDLFYPVENATGLEGAWDFTIDFDAMASRGMMAIRSQIFPGAGASTNGQAADPMGGLNLEDAIRKQLGLELKFSKHPQPVLVIDHMLEKPIDN